MKEFLLGVLSSLAAGIVLAIFATSTSVRTRRLMARALGALTGTDLDATFVDRSRAAADIRTELRSAKEIRLLAGRGSELQRETFEALLSKRPALARATFRVLLPVSRGGRLYTYWLRSRESEVSSFDLSFRTGMLAAQVDANVRFLRPHIESGTTQLRRYNCPHLGRILLTDRYCYFTPYRATAHGRESPVMKYRRGDTYDWFGRLFELLWQAGSDPDVTGIRSGQP
jgi:hypothetical protein